MCEIKRMELRVHSIEEMQELFICISKEIKSLNDEMTALDESISEYDTIFLYGAGTDGKVIADRLWPILQEKTVFFLDKNKDKQDKEIYKGILCKSVETAYGYGKRGAIILTSSCYADEIKRELLKEDKQTQERLLGISIIDRYCQILVKLKEKQMLMDNQESMLHYYDLLAEHTLQCDPYGSIWGINYARQFIYNPQKIVKESLNTLQRFGSYLEMLSAKGGRTIIGGYMVENILVRAKEFWGSSHRVDIYELNRIYGNELKGKYPEPLFHFHDAGLGEITEIIPYDRFDDVCGRYGYLDFISDDEVQMLSLDEEMLKLNDDASEETEKTDLIILWMLNAETAALKGMKRLLEKDRPALMVECGGHFTHSEEYYWNIACLLDSWGLEYRFITREIHRLGGFLCAIPKERL